MGLCLSALTPANAENDTEEATRTSSSSSSVLRPDEVGLEHFYQELAAEAAAVLRAMDSSDNSDDGSHVANEELDAVEAELAVTSPLLRPDRADQKYKEAVAEAVKACADDTKGQTCYICREAVHWKTKEGLVRGCACRGTAGFAHVSCLAEQVKILREDAVANNKDSQWHRWHTCSLCEQHYHGVVACALGWACWKTYVGRPEEDETRCLAMGVLGNFLSSAKHYEDALSVREGELSMRRRLGDSEGNILSVQTNLANTYDELGRLEEAIRIKQDVYSGRLKLNGEEHRDTLLAASNYASSLNELERFEEAMSLMRKVTPMARRVFGESNQITLTTRCIYAEALCRAAGATRDDLREAVTTLEDAERIAQRVFGGAHPITEQIEVALRTPRAALGAREA